MKMHSIMGYSPEKYQNHYLNRQDKSNFLETLRQSFLDIERNLKPNASSGEDKKLSRESPEPSLLRLGTITQSHPTVSDLLIKNPEYRNRCWQIVHSKHNQHKPFTRIQTGTEIYIRPETLEIVWEDNGYTPYHLASGDLGNSPSAQPVQSNDNFSEKLADAVVPFIGQSYDEVDCYELIVNGLKRLGVQYSGQGGLKEKLIRKAEEKGYAENALLTGEGLIQVTGKTLYEKFIPLYTNSESMMQEVFHTLEPMLKRGQVLSFSTPTRGHTGIVSGNQGLWTYINSGRLDHHIGKTVTSKGVGEESLVDELKNWFRLAVERHEPLQITLGQLDEKKLVMLPSPALRHQGRV